MSDANRDETVRAYVDLLDRPVLFSDRDGPAFRRVRARLPEIRRWFAERTDWNVIANRDFIRLEKRPVRGAVGLGLTWAKEARDYELLIWCLWFAEGLSDDQFLLTQLVEEIEVRANERLGPGHLDWDDYATRLSLQRALKGLEELGAFRRIDRELEDWVRSRTGNTLYEATPFARYLVAHWPAAILGELDGAERTAELDALRNRAPLPGAPGPEQRLYRTLLLEPAVYACEDPEAFAWLRPRDRRERLALDLYRHTGWDLEVTESYACLLRAGATFGGDAGLFPFRGALCHVLLLLFSHVREQIAQGALAADRFDCVEFSSARLIALLADLREQHGDSWSKAVSELGAASLSETVIDTLQRWSLLEGPDADGRLRLLPLAARFRGAYDANEEEAAWL